MNPILQYLCTISFTTVIVSLNDMSCLYFIYIAIASFWYFSIFISLFILFRTVIASTSYHLFLQYWLSIQIENILSVLDPHCTYCSCRNYSTKYMHGLIAESYIKHFRFISVFVVHWSKYINNNFKFVLFLERKKKKPCTSCFLSCRICHIYTCALFIQCYTCSYGQFLQEL